MGRTVETFTMVIQEQQTRWKKFREALRKEDQEILDELFCAPKIHLAACAYAVTPIPFENIVMSILLEERKRSIALQETVNKLNERVRKLETENVEATCNPHVQNNCQERSAAEPRY